MQKEEIVEIINKASNQKNRESLARFGIPNYNAIGMTNLQLRALAKEIGKNHELALALWSVDIYEAKVLATLIDNPALLTIAQMQLWAKAFNSWALCDSACFNLYRKNAIAWQEVYYFAKQEEEFIRRTAFSLIAGLAISNEEAKDEVFLAYLALCYEYTEDPRIYVRKAVNWAIRQIGKRNLLLNEAAIILSNKIRLREDKTSKWIAGDALRELKSEAVKNSLNKKDKKIIIFE